jgi:hypothetical protein
MQVKNPPENVKHGLGASALGVLIFVVLLN